MFLRVKPHVHLNNVLCLLLFSYYFYDLYSKLFYLKSSLLLTPNAQLVLPSPIICVRYAQGRISNLTFFYIPRRVELIDKNRQRQRLKLLGFFHYGSKIEHFICSVYSIQHPVREGFFVIWSIENGRLSQISFYYESIHEIVQMNMFTFTSTNSGYAHELLMIKTIYENDFRRPCDDKKKLVQKLANYSVKLGFFRFGNFDNEYSFAYSEQNKVKAVMSASCERYQQYVVNRKYSLKENLGQLADDSYILSYQIQEPQLHFHIRFEITLADFFWYTFQLCSTFFGICLYNSFDFVKKGLSQVFHPGNSVLKFEKTLKIIFAAAIFFFFSVQYVDEFVHHNVVSEPLLEMTENGMPDIGLSICFDLKKLPSFFYENKCQPIDLSDLETRQPINRLMDYRLLIDCFLSNFNNQTLWYFRKRRLCVKKMVKQMSDLDRAMAEDDASWLFFANLYVTRIKGPCLDSECFFVFIHPANDLIRSESQHTEASVVLNQVFIKKQLPSASGCVDYSQSGFFNPDHCYEHCVINSYVIKHDLIPSWVSFAPSQHSKELSLKYFSNTSFQMDSEIEFHCRRRCEGIDCNLVLLKPVSFKQWSEPLIVVSRQTFLIITQQMYLTTWLELLLKLLSLAGFCLGFSLSSHLLDVVQLVVLSNIKLVIFFRFLLFAKHLLFIFFILTISFLSAPILGNPLTVTTNVQKTDFVALPPSLFVCRLKSTETNLTLEKILERVNLTHHSDVPRMILFSFNYRLKANVTVKLKETPFYACLHLTLNYGIRMPHRWPVYGLRTRGYKDYLFSVDHPRVFMPTLFIQRSLILIYIHVQTIFSDERYCRHYSQPKHSLWMRMVNEEFMDMSNKSSLADRLNKLKKKRLIFQKSHSLPDCILDQYLPTFEKEMHQNSLVYSGNVLALSDFQIQVLYENSFAYSRFAIFVLGTMEILLNVTFNCGMLNLLIRVGNHFRRRGIFGYSFLIN